MARIEELEQAADAARRYRRALLKIIRRGGCMCGGEGFFPGEMLHIQTASEKKNTFGHHEGCGPIIAARALGLKIKVY